MRVRRAHGRDRGDAERRALARSRWALTAQLAGAILAVITVVGAIVGCTVMDGQRRTAERELGYVIARDQVADPPPCVWIFTADGRHSPNAPAGLPITARPGTRERWISGRHYLVRTGRGAQAAMDLLYQDQERRRLCLALMIAEAAGLLAALVTGQLLARRAISPLEEALRRQHRFVADASHELRTPLTRLHLRAQLLARRMPGAELEAIVADTRQFGEVIEDLLLSARLGPAGGAPVDLADVARAAVSAEAARAHDRRVFLELHREGGTGDTADTRVNGIEAALRRVVDALVDNALGHTSPGGHIEVTVARRGRNVELTVRDDGRGFDQSQSELLFRRFAHGDNGEGRRFGLGLALARQVVESHEGSITAMGEPGKGASFTVTLPALAGSPSAGARIRRRAAP
jgi:signal transduction histidine kinase